MATRLLVSVGSMGYTHTVSMHLQDTLGKDAYYITYPVTYLESCDFAAWVMSAMHCKDNRITPTGDGWVFSMPVSELPVKQLIASTAHNSHRRITKDWHRFDELIDSPYHKVYDTDLESQ